jgi:hypothetical protein
MASSPASVVRVGGLVSWQTRTLCWSPSGRFFRFDWTAPADCCGGGLGRRVAAWRVNRLPERNQPVRPRAPQRCPVARATRTLLAASTGAGEQGRACVRGTSGSGSWEAAATRYAYLVNWDEKSFSSLKHNARVRFHADRPSHGPNVAVVDRFRNQPLGLRSPRRRLSPGLAKSGGIVGLRSDLGSRHRGPGDCHRAERPRQVAATTTPGTATLLLSAAAVGDGFQRRGRGAERGRLNHAHVFGTSVGVAAMVVPPE